MLQQFIECFILSIIVVSIAIIIKFVFLIRRFKKGAKIAIGLYEAFTVLMENDGLKDDIEAKKMKVEISFDRTVISFCSIIEVIEKLQELIKKVLEDYEKIEYIGKTFQKYEWEEQKRELAEMLNKVNMLRWAQYLQRSRK